jgi:hypothetical protein
MCRAGTHSTPAGLKHPTQYASHQPACASGQASKFSAECVLQHLLVEAEISDHLSSLLGDPGYRDAIGFSLPILVLLLRPEGLLGKKFFAEVKG